MFSRDKFRALISRGEDGQIVILAAFTMVVVFGFAALAVDIGSLTHERRDLQNAADAMALAGGSQLTTTSAGNSPAQAEAMKWADKNGLSTTEKANAQISFNQTCSGANKPNIITVRLERSKQTFLASVIGIDTMSTSVCATARRFSSAGGAGVAPFGVENDCIYGPDETSGNGDDWSEPGDWIIIKYDSSAGNDGDENGCGANVGNFWLLAIDAPGGGDNCGSPIPADSEERQLKEAICFGAITPLCTPAAVVEGEECETTVDTQTGNVNSIKDSLNYVVNNAPENCDTIDEIVVGGELVDACNPFLEDYQGTVSLVKIIPVLDGLFPDAKGKENVDIVDFIIVVIDPTFIAANCTGNNCDIRALYVEYAINPQALRKALDATSANNFTSLID
jgi:hypothetical protein